MRASNFTIFFRNWTDYIVHGVRGFFFLLSIRIMQSIVHIKFENWQCTYRIGVDRL